MFNESFFILVATIIFFGLFGKKLWGALQTFLNERIEKVKASMDEAEKLKQEAQNLLANTKRKHILAHEEAEKIKTHAVEEAEALKRKMEHDFDVSFKRRERMALERIEQMEAQAIQSIKILVSNMAIEAARISLEKNAAMSGEDLLSDIETGLKSYKKTIH